MPATPYDLSVEEILDAEEILDSLRRDLATAIGAGGPTERVSDIMHEIEAWQDRERQTGVILKVSGPNADGNYGVHWNETGDDSGVYVCLLQHRACQDAPVVGDVITHWGRGLGSAFRGQAVNDVVFWYRSDADQQAQQQTESSRRDEREKAEYIAARDDHDLRIAALPAVFQQRIHDFRERRVDFGWQFEKYELFVCEQAVVFAATFPTEDALKTFYDLDYQAQKAACPAMDDGHSGNTFGQAVKLALLFLSHPENVPQYHGALCPLVGCSEYGCWSFVAPQQVAVAR